MHDVIANNIFFRQAHAQNVRFEHVIICAAHTVILQIQVFKGAVAWCLRVQ